MTLKEIRNANEAQLIDAIKDVIKKQNVLTLGEIHATTQTILDRAKQIGMPISKINAVARGEKIQTTNTTIICRSIEAGFFV